MNVLFRNCIAMTGLALIAAISASANQADILETLRPAAERAENESKMIDTERAKSLQDAARFIRRRAAEGKSAELTFICTHNSRRSHLGQLWAQAAASYYGLSNVTTYSGGTEVAACNPRTVRALRRAGFSIVQSTSSTNPVYLAQFSDARPPVKLFSKVYNTEGNPQHDYAAMFACDHADAACPVVQGAALRVAVHYVDPKASDNTPAEDATYDERSRQIAREMFFLMRVAAGKGDMRASR